MLVNDIDYDGVGFPVREKDLSKIETKYYNSNRKFETSMDLFLITDENKSHYVYIKGFDRFMSHKTKNKNKNSFERFV